MICSKFTVAVLFARLF